MVTSAVPVKQALTSHEIVSGDSPLYFIASGCTTEYLEIFALPRECTWREVLKM
jgi:hypothetical protein